MKLHLHLNSGSSTHWKYSLGVKDILPKNMTHLWVFVFLLAAPRCECLRVSGRKTWGCCLWAHDSLSSLSPGVLSLVQLQERGPCLLKPSQTLSITCSISGYSTSSYHLWSWIPQPTEKELQWVVHDYRDEDIYYNPSLKSPITMAVDIVQSQCTLQMSSIVMENTTMYHCDIQWQDFTNLPAGDRRPGLYESLKAHPTLDLRTESGVGGNSQRNSLGFSGFLSSPTSQQHLGMPFFVLSHASYCGSKIRK
jgi:immunoglobulin heavy chain